jgi:hypothetical protein
MTCWKWVRESISDESGQADIAYIAIAALTGGALGALGFVCAMSAWAFWTCIPLVKPDVVVNCTYDPLPLGQSAGLIFAAFATLIGSLCGYMLATRKPRSAPDQNVFAKNAQVNQVSAPDAEPVAIIGKAAKR